MSYQDHLYIRGLGHWGRIELETTFHVSVVGFNTENEELGDRFSTTNGLQQPGDKVQSARMGCFSNQFRPLWQRSADDPRWRRKW